MVKVCDCGNMKMFVKKTALSGFFSEVLSFTRGRGIQASVAVILFPPLTFLEKSSRRFFDTVSCIGRS